jgi:steroid 5-alpha reductase family enzyme
MLLIFLPSVILIFIFFTVFFIIAQIIKNNSIVDIGWGLGFIVISLYTFFFSGDITLRSILVTILVLIWGSRLSYHILRRNWGKPEDFRYAKWRREWGKWLIIRGFFQIFMLQGLIMLIIASPIIYINYSRQIGLQFLDYLGAAVWLIGFLFESIGDAQLAQFIKKPENKGQIMKYGLWRYTRHPNYFGEATMWWGIYIIALSLLNGFWLIISPLTITFMLLYVSGIPMLEKKFADNPKFQQYARMTPKFFPWFPRKIKESEEN